MAGASFELACLARPRNSPGVLAHPSHAARFCNVALTWPPWACSKSRCVRPAPPVGAWACALTSSEGLHFPSHWVRSPDHVSPGCPEVWRELHACQGRHERPASCRYVNSGRGGQAHTVARSAWRLTCSPQPPPAWVASTCSRSWRSCGACRRLNDTAPPLVVASFLFCLPSGVAVRLDCETVDARMGRAGASAAAARRCLCPAPPLAPCRGSEEGLVSSRGGLRRARQGWVSSQGRGRAECAHAWGSLAAASVGHMTSAPLAERRCAWSRASAEPAPASRLGLRLARPAPHMPCAARHTPRSTCHATRGARRRVRSFVPAGRRSMLDTPKKVYTPGSRLDDSDGAGDAGYYAAGRTSLQVTPTAQPITGSASRGPQYAHALNHAEVGAPRAGRRGGSSAAFNGERGDIGARPGVTDRRVEASRGQAGVHAPNPSPAVRARPGQRLGACGEALGWVHTRHETSHVRMTACIYTCAGWHMWWARKACMPNGDAWLKPSMRMCGNMSL
eukprot:350192-Chlamydomonas_euryale.AAC.4